MRSLLLSSVSASAVIAGGSGGVISIHTQRFYIIIGGPAGNIGVMARTQRFYSIVGGPAGNIGVMARTQRFHLIVGPPTTLVSVNSQRLYSIILP
jgi:hypothetical protein